MGDPRALAQFLELAKIFNNSNAVESTSGGTLAAEDQAILDAFAEDIRSRLPDAALHVKPAIADDGTNQDG